MSDDRMSFVIALGPCSWSFRIASMTEISVLVVSSPQNAAQSFATNLRAGGRGEGGPQLRPPSAQEPAERGPGSVVPAARTPLPTRRSRG